MSQQINLYRPVFLEQRKIFSARLLGAALAVVTLALAGIHATQRVQLSVARQQLADANRQHDAAKQELAKFAAERQRPPSRLLVDEAGRLEARLKAQSALVEQFDSGALGNTEGFSRYLTALARQTMPGVWITGFAANADGVRALRGHLTSAELLPAYLRMLHREEAMRGHGFSEIRVASGATAAGGARPSGEGPEQRAIEFTLGPSARPGGQR